MVKNPPASAREEGSVSGSGISPGGGNSSPFQDSCLENPMDKRSLVGYRPRGHKESDTTERLHFSLHLSCIYLYNSPLALLASLNYTNK